MGGSLQVFRMGATIRYADGMSDAEKPQLRWYQYRLRTLLILIAVAAVLCSAIKAATSVIPIELLLAGGGFFALAAAVAAVPAALIGRRINRTFESVYLGVLWGLFAASLVVLYDFMASLSFASQSPSWMYTASKAVIGAMAGGCFGGWFMWRIKRQ